MNYIILKILLGQPLFWRVIQSEVVFEIKQLSYFCLVGNQIIQFHFLIAIGDSIFLNLRRRQNLRHLLQIGPFLGPVEYVLYLRGPNCSILHCISRGLTEPAIFDFGALYHLLLLLRNGLHKEYVFHLLVKVHQYLVQIDVSLAAHDVRIVSIYRIEHKLLVLNEVPLNPLERLGRASYVKEECHLAETQKVFN
jgi:hypothetical protein